jgi:hypothetical protein
VLAGATVVGSVCTLFMLCHVMRCWGLTTVAVRATVVGSIDTCYAMILFASLVQGFASDLRRCLVALQLWVRY